MAVLLQLDIMKRPGQLGSAFLPLLRAPLVGVEMCFPEKTKALWLLANRRNEGNSHQCSEIIRRTEQEISTGGFILLEYRREAP